MNHTKGIWKWDGNRLRSYEGGGVDVCLTSHTFSEEDEAKKQANRSLVAAAPEMLAALIKCRSALAKYESEQSINAWYLADSSIKKALGR